MTTDHRRLAAQPSAAAGSSRNRHAKTLRGKALRGWTLRSAPGLPSRRALLTLLVAAFTIVAVACQPAGEAGGPADDGPATEATAEDTAGGENGDGGGALAGDPVHGEEVYQGTCGTCHGPDATGIEGLGKDLHNNAFVAERTDEEMLEFLKVGRPAGDPLNTTGVDMPPKGGNPALTDDDLVDVVAYLRTLN